MSVVVKLAYLTVHVHQVCADGCGWGDGARTAARIAVLSMLRTLTTDVLSNIYSSKGEI